MKNVLGIIFADSHYAKLNELTNIRPIAALPVAGRYRLIDFVLSNMVNSGMKNVAVVTQNNYHSLMDHLGSGKQWNLARKRNGLVLFPPFSNVNSTDLNSRLGNLYGLIGFLKKSTQNYVLLAEPNIISASTFNNFFEDHINSKADISICLQKKDATDMSEDDAFIGINKSNDVTQVDLGGNPNNLQYKYAGFILISKQKLINIIENAKVQRSSFGYMTTLILKNLEKEKIKAFCYDRYLKKINNIDNYFEVNMSMLDAKVRKSLFNGQSKIYTKEKDSTPAIYLNNANVKNSLIADGCVVDGQVENSIIFRNVHIEKGTVIKNSIILEHSVIGAGAHLENVILDKKCVVNAKKKLIGTDSYKIVIPKGTVI